jgi:4a-hydroxytetrahydrobiopterin dehydratase
VRLIVVAQKAHYCDDLGFVVPSTNGDIGDKIYGKKAKAVLSPIAKSNDEQSVHSLSDLLVQHGGRWSLTGDGKGIKRNIEFQTFKLAWVY